MQRIGGPLLVTVLVVLMLAPFVDRAFHIDDTLFVRLAEQIQKSPNEPFEFEYNWFGTPESFWKVTQNPPLGGYLLAAVTALFGPGERPLHAAYIALATGCALLMHSLAGRFCAHPTLATLLVLLTPAFWISACSVMADIPLLFFWLVAIWGAVRYVETLRAWPLVLACLAIAAAALTKYFGIAALPLIAVYVLPRNHRSTGAVLALALPIMALGAWGLYAYEQSGNFHVLGAAEYAVGMKRSWLDVGRNALHSVGFLGGTMVWPVVFLPAAIRLPKWWWPLIVLPAGVSLGIEWSRTFPSAAVLHGVEVLAGAFVLAAAIEHWRGRRDLATTLLVLWLLGTMVFCGLLNWTVNARTILQAIFPATLLLLRWLETPAGARARALWLNWLRVALAPTLAVSLLGALADNQFAGAGREFASTRVREFVEQGRIVHFAGHWGWQYYAENAGARPIDVDAGAIRPGDLVVYPALNSNIQQVNPPTSELEFKSFPNNYLLHTANPEIQAGFYFSGSGILPLAYDSFAIADAFVVEEAQR